MAFRNMYWSQEGDASRAGNTYRQAQNAQAVVETPATSHALCGTAGLP